jgi:hypothetical protein
MQDSCKLRLMNTHKGTVGPKALLIFSPLILASFIALDYHHHSFVDVLAVCFNQVIIQSADFNRINSHSMGTINTFIVSSEIQTSCESSVDAWSKEARWNSLLPSNSLLQTTQRSSLSNSAICYCKEQHMLRS